MREAETALKERQSQLQEATSRVENLLLDLESRPTVQEWRRVQQELQTLQRKVTQTKRCAQRRARSPRPRTLTCGRGRSMRELSKYADTRELIKRDRELHELGLHAIDHLPREVAVEILQDLCRCVLPLRPWTHAQRCIASRAASCA
jgi:hypothetical protein